MVGAVTVTYSTMPRSDKYWTYPLLDNLASFSVLFRLLLLTHKVVVQTQHARTGTSVLYFSVLQGQKMTVFRFQSIVKLVMF